jgi:hypothetical protein
MDHLDATPEFARFKEVMRGVLSVSKKRLDELVKASRAASPRNGDGRSPGRKRGASSFNKKANSETADQKALHGKHQSTK